MEIRYGRKRRGIKRELKAKISEWIESIDNENVKKIAHDNTIVTGGSIASMLLGEQVNDFDVYFRTKTAAKAIAEYYIGKFNAKNTQKIANHVTPYQPFLREERIKNIRGEEEDRLIIYIKSAGVAGENPEGKDAPVYSYFESLPPEEMEKFLESIMNTAADGPEKPKYRPVFLSMNAITLSDKIQLITRFYGEPDEIHRNYDFVHARCYWDHAKEKLVLPPDALEALLSRTLIYVGSLYPIASIFRMKKFIERGWRITAGQQLKIMWQISEISLKDPQTLRDQLTGVDMAYLWQVIESLQNMDPSKIDSTYIAEVIDRIFED